MPAKSRKISDIKPLFTNLAQTSHYQVQFGGLNTQLISYLSRRGVDPFFVNESAGLLCYNASLPTGQLNVKMVDGNYTGVQEKFAYSRSYSEISLDFYVDSQYKTLKFLESWMEFIASGSHNNINGVSPAVNQGEKNYFVRMQYPEYYKCDSTKIIKFDRNYNAEIQYTFRGLWPTYISPPTISYVSSDVLKVSAGFQYDRYIVGRPLGINQYQGNIGNNAQTQQTISQQTTSREPVYYQSAGAGVNQGVTPRPTSYPTTF